MKPTANKTAMHINDLSCEKRSSAFIGSSRILGPTKMSMIDESIIMSLESIKIKSVSQKISRKQTPLNLNRPKLQLTISNRGLINKFEFDDINTV